MFSGSGSDKFFWLSILPIEGALNTGRSTQHVRGIANNIKIEAKRLGMKVVGIEGAETGHWMLIDLAEVVVHVMTEKTREFYKLEKLWSGADEE
jgi:ribosome-associated protein